MSCWQVDLEQWLRENYMSYNSKQLNSIINCTTAQFSKMMLRSRLSGIVDELIKKSWFLHSIGYRFSDWTWKCYKM